jgi:hypothetical protein
MGWVWNQNPAETRIKHFKVSKSYETQAVFDLHNKKIINQAP